MDEINEIGIKTRLFNNAIVERRKQRGLTQGQLAQIAGTTIAIVGGYETLRVSPIHKLYGKWKATALNIAEALDTHPEVLWKDIVQRIECRAIVATFPAKELEILYQTERARLELETINPEEVLEQKEQIFFVSKALEKINKKYAFVLIKRLEGETHKQIAKQLGVTRSRTQQIEQRAIEQTCRILKHKIRRV